MKNFKAMSLLLVLVAFFISCNNDNDFYEEQTSLDKDITRTFKARDDMPDTFYHQLYTANSSIEGYRFSTSSYERDYNDYYFYSDDYDRVIAMDYNKVDKLVYFIGGGYSGDERYLYSLEMETEELTELGLLSGDDRDKSSVKSRTEDEYLGKAHDLTFDANGNLYIAFKSGKIMQYNLVLNTMDVFVDLNDYEFYAGSNAVGFTYDFDNDRLLYSSNDEYYEYTEGNYYNYYWDSAFLGIACSTSEVSELFTLRNPQSYNNEYEGYVYFYAVTTNMEYIGDNKIVYSDWWDNGEFHAVDLTSGEFVFSDDDDSSFYAKDLMYIYNPDVDGDGVLNEDDPYPSSNMDEMLSIGTTNFDIENQFSDEGTTMMDQIDALISEINEQYDGSNGDALHRMFTRELSKITYYWYKSRLISRRERTQISRAASNMSIPFYNQEPG